MKAAITFIIEESVRPVKHLLGIRDLEREDAIHILSLAESYRLSKTPPNLRLSVLLAFFQSSTRTRIGFASATVKLGGIPIDLYALRSDRSMSADETIADTMRCASGLVDLVVLRHSDAKLHSDAVAASVCPVINAGNGSLEHPTQALLDLFAILKHKGTIDGLRIGLVGDMGSRSAHSLLAVLSWFKPAEIRLMYPPDRGMPFQYLKGMERFPINEQQTLNLSGLDVIYIVGLPANIGNDFLTEQERSQWTLSDKTLEKASKDSLVLCPLPRIDEIDKAVDSDPRCRYFQQSDDGLFVRMAVLEWLHRINEE